MNGSLGVEKNHGSLRLSLFAKNLFNKNFATLIFATPFDTQGPTATGYGQIIAEGAQRIVGVAIDARF